MQFHRKNAAAVARPVTTVAVAGTAFVVLADSVAEGDGLSSLDPAVAADVIEHRTGALTMAAQLLTFLGSEVVVGVLAMALVVILLGRRGPKPAILAAVAMAVSAGLTVGVKTTIGRARPGESDRLGPFDSSYSFPSGHTLNSTVLLGLVCLFLVPLMPRRRARLGAYGLSLLLAVGVGASRIYLGYHWTTDVLASWTLAVMTLTIVHVVNRLLTRAAQQSGNVQVDRATVDS